MHFFEPAADQVYRLGLTSVGPIPNGVLTSELRSPVVDEEANVVSCIGERHREVSRLPSDPVGAESSIREC